MVRLKHHSHYAKWYIWTRVEDTGMHKYTGTSFASVGYFISLTFQKYQEDFPCSSKGTRNI